MSVLLIEVLLNFRTQKKIEAARDRFREDEIIDYFGTIT